MFDASTLISDSRLAFLQGRYDESLKLAKCAIALASNNADANQCAGNAYMSKAHYKSAIEHYKKALEYDADNGDRYFNPVNIKKNIYGEHLKTITKN